MTDVQQAPAESLSAGTQRLAAPVRPQHSGWTRFRRKLSPSLIIGTILLFLILIASIFAPLIAWHAPNETFPGMSLSSPELSHPFGTDSIGRDVFSRVLHGGRVSLLIAIPSVILALTLGLFLGVPAGYFGGRIDQLIMRFLDIVFAFPALLLAILVVSILGASIQNLILTIGIIYTPRMARIARAPILSTKTRDFVEASRAMGAPEARVVFRHVLPNSAAPIIVEVSLALSQIIITETALSFLGLGPPPPNPSWGAMLSQSRQFMEFASWTVLAPGFAIVVAVSSFLLIGHGMRQFMDPHQHRR
jgi:peptide/nickel transport system permease protein